MVEENSLVVFTRAEQMLAQAVTIQQAKELKNLALTAADWARRKNMGDKAISHARGYALEAERKMGQMLKQTERAKGGQPYQETPTSAQGALVEAQPTLAELGITKKESSRAQKLAGVPRESFDRIKTGDETLSKVNAQFRTSFTGENEWYTPKKYVDAVKAVMGDIDLDPASSDAAQKIVDAKNYFTPKDDGLSMLWDGRVFLNPPYSQPHIANFIKKAADEYKQTRITECIILTYNYTDTAWFHLAESVCAGICFTKGRIKFHNAWGDVAAPTQGSAFFYWGENLYKFTEVFEEYGFVR